MTASQLAHAARAGTRGSLEEQLAVAHRLVSGAVAAPSDRQEAARLLQEVDEALDDWARATEDAAMAS